MSRALKRKEQLELDFLEGRSEYNTLCKVCKKNFEDRSKEPCEHCSKKDAIWNQIIDHHLGKYDTDEDEFNTEDSVSLTTEEEKSEDSKEDPNYVASSPESSSSEDLEKEVKEDIKESLSDLPYVTWTEITGESEDPYGNADADDYPDLIDADNDMDIFEPLEKKRRHDKPKFSMEDELDSR